MSERHADPILLPLWEAVGMFSCVVLVIGIFGALLTAVGRLIFFLKTDYWIKSACETAAFLTIDTTAWCNINTEWKGFDRFYNWATNSLDVSAFLLITGVVFFAVSLVTMIVALTLSDR